MRLTILLVVAAACSPDNNHEHVDAAPPPDTAVDAHHDVDAPVVARQGLIILSEVTTVGNPADSGVDVTIADSSPMGMVTGTDGPCKAYGGGAGPMKYSAGNIAITGTTVALTLTPSSSGHYTSMPSAPTDLFASGAAIHIAAAGAADFGAFAGDVTAPAPVAGFTPPSTISISAGTTLTWTEAPSTVMQVALFAGTATTFGLLFCRVPDNGSFVVPPSSMALLPAGSTTGGILLGRTNETVVTVSSGTVALQVISAAGSETVTFTN